MKRFKFYDKPSYNIVVYALCFLMIFLCLGFCSSCKTIFLTPVTSALGISRSAFSVADTFRFVFGAIVNAFFGTLVAKFGTKKLILAGLLFLVASMLLYSYSTALYGFYAAGAFLGIGFSWTTTSMVGSIIRRRAVKNVGTVMGIVLAANGFGGAVATNILTPIIARDTFSYRKAYLLIAVLVAVVFLLFLFFYFDNNKTALQKDNKTAEKIDNENGIEIKEALKQPYFYMMCAFIFFSCLVMQGLVTSYSSILEGTGVSKTMITTVISIHTLALAFSKILSGRLYDKFGLKVTVIVCMVCGILNLCALLTIGDTLLGKIILIISSLLFALSLPLETVMLPIYASDFFGLKSYDNVLGIFVSISYAGMAIGPPAMNLFYDILGNYKVGLISLLCVLFVVIFVFLISVNLSNKHKKQIERM